MSPSAIAQSFCEVRDMFHWIGDPFRWFEGYALRMDGNWFTLLTCLVCCLLSFMVIASLLGWVYRKKESFLKIVGSLATDYFGMFFVVAVGLIVGMIWSPVVLWGRVREIPANTFACYNGKVVAEYPHFIRIWKYQDPTLAKAEFLPMGAIAIVAGSATVHPITPNPKVRDLDCWVRLATAPDPKRVAYLKHRFNIKGEIDSDDLAECQRRLCYWIVEYNEHHSKELAVFYNQYDPDQQAKVEAILRAYLEPKIAKEWHGAIKFESAGFTMGEGG